MINNPSIYGTELRGYWLPLTIRRKDSIMLNQNANNPTVGATIARVAVDMLKISVAVAGGIAVYKLCENYLAGSDTPCLGGGCATPSLPGDGAYATGSEAAAFCNMSSVNTEF
jgi:hypothetical protein